MSTLLTVYRCLLSIFVCLLNLTQWIHATIVRLVRRHRYTITVNIDVIREDTWQTSDDLIDKVHFNKSTPAVALIINEHIPDLDLCMLISNAIRFFRRLHVQHVIIYDYEGYAKVHQPSIMAHLDTCDKTVHALPTVHFLSLNDCSQTLSQVAQHLCQQVQQNEITIDSIQSATVDRYYTELAHLPEINLALIIGPIKSALGLHPWLIRLTEFIMIDSYKQLQTIHSFIGIVHQYNRIEQRQGR